MLARTSLALALALLACAAPLRAQDDESDGGSPSRRSAMPPSRLFSCELPASGWTGFEEEDAQGAVVYILGPEDPAGEFRTAFSLRWFDKDQPGFQDAKKAVAALRKSDPEAKRSAGAVLPMRVGSMLARVFEVQETRLLPLDRLPAREQVLHRYVAVLPQGSGYYLLTLTSTRDTYLDFRGDWMRCLSTFRPLGR